jgi:hypothetical protein
MAMTSTENAYRTARCTNVAACPRAAAGEPVEWYLGAGEYCPDCGEALVAGYAAPFLSPGGGPIEPASPAPGEPNPKTSLAASASAPAPISARSVRGDMRLPLTAFDRLAEPPTARESGFVVQFRWF